MRKGLAVLAAGAILVTGQPALAHEQACMSGLPQWQPRALESVPQAPYVAEDGRIRIVGYNDMAEMLEALARLFTAAHPEFRFELVLKGTRTGPPALISGKSLFAPMGAEFTDADLAAYRRVHGNEPLMVRIAHASLSDAARSSPLGIYVHRDNPLGAISTDTVRRIFTGRHGRPAISRWGQLGVRSGWASRTIRLAGMGRSTALGLFMRKHFLGGRDFAANFAGMAQSRDVIDFVARNPDAMGFANLSHADENVRVVPLVSKGGEIFAGTESEVRSGRYPLDRHLLIYVARARNGSLDPVAREWLDLMLSCQGQQAIAQGTLGYLPLNPDELRQEMSVMSLGVV